MTKEVKKTLADEFMQMPIKELVKSIEDMKSDLYSLKVQNHIRAEKQTHKLTILKRNIARAKQVLHDKIAK